MGNSSQQVALQGGRESILFCMAVDFRDTLQSKPQSASCPFFTLRRPDSSELVTPSRRGKISLKCHWWCPDWHRDMAPSQFTLLISQRSKGVRVKLKLLKCWMQQLIFDKNESAHSFAQYFCFSVTWIKTQTTATLFLYSFFLFAPPYRRHTGVLDIDCGLVTQLWTGKHYANIVKVYDTLSVTIKLLQ